MKLHTNILNEHGMKLHTNIWNEIFLILGDWKSLTIIQISLIYDSSTDWVVN